MTITVVRGDITRQPVEAVVTAGNSSLRGGSGVNGAVHAAAGPQLLRASRALAPCPTGSAVVTGAFSLAPVRWVIHAVGPRYNDRDSGALLKSAYRSALACADEVGAKSVAFPSISTGVYGYPAELAAQLSVEAIFRADTDVDTILLVAYNEQMAGLWDDALGELGPA